MREILHNDEAQQLRELIMHWRQRTHVDLALMKTSHSHIYRAAGREQQDNECAAELEAWLEQRPVQRPHTPDPDAVEASGAGVLTKIAGYIEPHEHIAVEVAQAALQRLISGGINSDEMEQAADILMRMVRAYITLREDYNRLRESFDRFGRLKEESPTPPP